MREPTFLSDGEVDDTHLDDKQLVEPLPDEVPVNPWVERLMWLLVVAGTSAMLWGVIWSAWQLWRWFVRALLR